MSKDSNKGEGRRVGLRPFGDVLVDLSQGDLERELTTSLAELTRACDATKKGGKLVLTITIKPGPKMMQIAADYKVTIPKPTLESTSFYNDDRGSLHIENPRQQKMPFEAGPKLASVKPTDGVPTPLPEDDGDDNVH